MTGAGDRLYRLLLLAFPPAFRQRHAAGMTAQFQAQRGALAGRPLALGSLWARAAADAVWNGLALRRDGTRPHGPSHVRRPGTWSLAFFRDVRYAARSLRRDLSGTAIIVTILTAGIAANAIMFGIVDQLLLSPPAGVGHAEAVRRIHFGSETPRPGSRIVEQESYRLVAAIRDGVDGFDAAAVTSYLADVTLGAGADARPATIQMVDADYFPVLELRPGAGRFFTPSEGALPDGAPVVVLSHAFWLREYAADPAAVGQALRVEGRLLTVVGIGPEGFGGIEDGPVDAWVPISTLAATLLGDDWSTRPAHFRFGLVARLAAGGTSERADAQATATYRTALAGAEMRGDGEDAIAFTTPLEGRHAPNGVPAVGQVGLWLLGVAWVVLLVAIANVAGLLLTRALSRRREIAVRLALGVSRGRLLRQFLAESALLAAVAMAVALGVAWLGGQVVQQVLLPGYPWDAGVVDARVLALTLVIGVLTALGAGLAPAAQAWSTDLNDSLRTASPVTGGRTGLLRTGLLVAQVALCVVLLVGAGLFVRSLSAVLAHDVGMDLDRLVLASLPVLPAMTTAGADAQHAEAVARVGHLPGVARATVTRGSGPASISMGTSVLLEHWTLSDTNGRAMPQLYVVEPGYFETIGASIERGRGFSTEDAIPGTRVAVVNRAMQADFWPDADPIGECLRVGNKRPCTPVVGVVENVLAYSRVNVNTPQLYLLTAHPFADGRVPRALLMRLAAGAAPESVVPEIRRTLQSMSPDMPFVPVDMLEAVVAPQLQPWRLGSTMFLVFGGVALFIAAVGLYGALSHAVSQRSREIGIRIALGATRWHVVAQIARRGALTIAAGTLVGLLLAAYSTRWLTDLLYETSPRDPIVFVVVGLVLAAAGLAAAIVPARRSARVDPLVVLKTE